MSGPHPAIKRRMQRIHRERLEHLESMGPVTTGTRKELRLTSPNWLIDRLENRTPRYRKTRLSRYERVRSKAKEKIAAEHGQDVADGLLPDPGAPKKRMRMSPLLAGLLGGKPLR